jgi:hypothetical protein
MILHPYEYKRLADYRMHVYHNEAMRWRLVKVSQRRTEPVVFRVEEYSGKRRLSYGG